MMGNGHRVAGVAAWLVTAPALLHVHGTELVIGAVIVGATAHGAMSPDADQRGWLAKIIPGGHRGVTHLWVWPVLALLLAPRLGVYAWQVQAVAVAHGSHILGDAVFGRVPVLPKSKGWWRVGLGLKTGGLIERAVVVPALVCVGVWYSALAAGIV
jgi:membrane-bound metal-dependent hydrolase YbcI (DUF457 family)